MSEDRTEYNTKPKKKKQSKGSVKSLITEYLKNKGITYSDWLEEKHNELLQEMITNNLIEIKEGDKNYE